MNTLSKARIKPTYSDICLNLRRDHSVRRRENLLASNCINFDATRTADWPCYSSVAVDCKLDMGVFVNVR